MNRANVADCLLPRPYYLAAWTAKPFEGIRIPLSELLDFSRLNARAGFITRGDHDGYLWNASISPAIPKLLKELT